MVSVLITARNEKQENLKRTVKSLHETAIDPIEVLVAIDGGEIPDLDNAIVHVNNTPLGRRVSNNILAAKADGEYLFFLDAHCNMTPGWDRELVSACGDINLSYCVIQDIDEETWEYKPGKYGFVSLNRNLVEKWWDKKPLDQCGPVEQSMAITGCAWMVKKTSYWELGGYDEHLGPYGYDGPEWSLKVQLANPPGKVLLCTNVVCGHVFGTNNGNKLYRPELMTADQWREEMYKTYGKAGIDTLIQSFGDVPDWNALQERTVTINRDETVETKDQDGKILKRVIKHHRYVHTDDGQGMTEKELADKYGPSAPYIGEDVYYPNQHGELVKVSA